ncbi:uncharacterized protein LOC130085444 [Rhinichthys klamathensis goyatoka]|uniref:uncharacterized protein LOC130085444 n=1 Tax=Rhinichthys klamathensis goyatoka TaxID=3034132 RepID=UPI0024B52FC7|nr:uncharacterized protein LOC130085444 [Rhinichthys klamathensis goyatoka]
MSGSVKTDKPLKPTKSYVFTRKTEVSSESGDKQNIREKKVEDPDRLCPLHNKPHPLRKCRGFRSKTVDEQKAYLKEKHICFKCCASTSHLAKNCDKSVQCKECNSNKHLAALHPGPVPWKSFSSAVKEDHGGEQQEDETPEVMSKCTEVCGDSFGSRSCSKICLVRVYPAGQREKAVKAYAVLDEQSNKSLAKTELFDLLGIGANAAPYTLKTCSGIVETSGRRANNLIVESIDGNVQISLPSLIECDMMPDDRSEIPSAEIAQHYSHLKPVADKIPAIDPDAAILLLLGRDILCVHKVRKQYNGPKNAPYAQQLDLGWVIVGEVCLRGAHKPSSINVYRTDVLPTGRTSFLRPCHSVIHIQEKFDKRRSSHSIQTLKEIDILADDIDDLGSTVFKRTKEDEKIALSIEDQAFLEIMDKNVHMNDANSWVAPLPFHSTRRRLPNNREQAAKRLSSLCRTLERKPDMKKQFMDFMQKIFESNQAELAPPLKENQECWYLPTFGVYHPKKPDQIRVVFDSSASHEGVSLNDILLKGPDLNNTLLGVLLRFRREPFAITAAEQQMFYCFTVCEEHRDFLRFLWFEDNDFTKPVTEYRMTVHVFGNSPSPAVAIYGLRRAAQEGQKEHGQDAKQFVMRNFYVDDGLASFSTAVEAIDILKRTREMLAESSIKLHKIASNSSTVMNAFPSEDHAKDLKDLDLSSDPLPRLGLRWDLQTDSFSFCVSDEEKPFTRRGILSTVNSVYDPLGFVAPITIQGKALVRDISIEEYDWDTKLPDVKIIQWKAWKDSLMELKLLQIQRTYLSVSLLATVHREICVFADLFI